MVFQTLIVYISLSIILYFAAKRSESVGFNHLIIALAIYAVIFGLRLGVGVDFWGYKQWYDSAYAGLGVNDSLEPGFNLLIKLCVALGMPFSVFLTIVAFMQIYLIFLSIKSYKSVYPMLALTFMLGCVWLTYANGLRQQLAFCIFAYSIQFISNKSFLKYYICVLLAFTFHSSAILLIPFYLLFYLRMEWFKNIGIQVCLLIIALIASTMSLVTNLVEPVEQFAELLGYGYYFNNSQYEFASEVHIGIGYFINLFVVLLLIFNSNYVKCFYDNSFIKIIYDLFFIGVLWHYIFIDSQLFSRINYYFYGFQYIFAALSMVALRQKRHVCFYLLIILYILIFIATLYRMSENTALFVFNWQNYQFPNVVL